VFAAVAARPPVYVIDTYPLPEFPDPLQPAPAGTKLHPPPPPAAPFANAQQLSLPPPPPP